MGTKLTINSPLGRKTVSIEDIKEYIRSAASRDDYLSMMDFATLLSLCATSPLDTVLGLEGKARFFDEFGLHALEVEVYDQIAEKFWQVEDAEVSVIIDRLTFNKGVTLSSLGRHEDSV